MIIKLETKLKMLDKLKRLSDTRKDPLIEKYV